MSRVARVLDVHEAIDSSCNGPDGCDVDPSFRVSTPYGDLDYCDAHVDAAVASLPEEWVAALESPIPGQTSLEDA